MGSSRYCPRSFHGSKHRGGYGLGFDAALRALVPVPGLNGQGGELVCAWLGWFSRRLAFSMLFVAVLGWNVAFVRKGLFDGLSWVDLDELSCLTGKSV
nr:MAG TPA: hypothetical protein [Caudoviricetes sp.]